MIKGLEALCYLDDIANGRKMNLDPHKLTLIVEKELKALGIIKEKKVYVRFFLKYCDDEVGLPIYNSQVLENQELTQEEFDLLKEVLE